jgi:pilus assembly protein CpaB
MKARGLVLIGVSALLGLAAVAWVKKPVSAGMATVVAAKVPLNFGDQLTPAKLTLVEMPPTSIPQGAFQKIEEITGPNENRVVLHQMVPGETVLATKISGTGGRAILSMIIDPAMRAATIRVNDVTGTAGFVQPGDRVDVMLTRGSNNNMDKEGSDTTLLLQNVKVLGVDQQSDDKKDKPTVAKAVTLEVSPEDAQKLTLAGNIGSLSLALRNYATEDAVAARRLSVADLVPTTPKTTPDHPAAATKAEESHQTGPKVEVIRGVDPTSYEVRKDETVLGDTSNSAKPKPHKAKQAAVPSGKQVAQATNG